MNLNYQKICQELLKDLPQRAKEVISRRFGLNLSAGGGVQKETLESIGKSYGITRERVRQIEEDGFLRLKPKIKDYQKIFQYFVNQFKTSGDLRKEEVLLNRLGGKNFQNQTYFLLTLGEPFKRFPENRDFYSFWATKKEAVDSAQKIIDLTLNNFEKEKRPLTIEELFEIQKDKFLAILSKNLNKDIFYSYLEISKKILENSKGQFGLKDWPEINPRGVKDKAYLVFKKENKPLHFTEVAQLIGQSVLPQTVHNELIKDFRFVLVGRGIYALREWGFEEGVVKDIILKILKEAKRPMTKEEILEKVLKQRMIKENTIFLNLSNKKYFLKTPQGYTVRKA